MANLRRVEQDFLLKCPRAERFSGWQVAGNKEQNDARRSALRLFVEMRLLDSPSKDVFEMTPHGRSICLQLEARKRDKATQKRIRTIEAELGK